MAGVFGSVKMVYSVGLYAADEKEKASERAMRMIEDGRSNVHVEILWREANLHLGPYVGFYASSYELES